MPIAIAAKLGLNDVIEHLLSNGADLNLSSKWGAKPLVIAAGYDHTETVDLLIKNGAELFHESPEYDREGNITSHRMICYAMLSAADKGSIETVELLESYGASINEFFLNGESIISRSAACGNLSLLKYLISRGLDVNSVAGKTPTYQGWAPLHHAVRANQLECVKVLLDSGADINLISYNLSKNNPWYETPLDFCKREEKRELHNYLRSKGAKYAKELPKPQEN